MIEVCVLERCFLCGFDRRFGPNAYRARYCKSWDVIICNVCRNSLADGIVPTPVLLDRLASLGIEPKPNARGLIDIPD
ncbi:hypothetical protein KKP04_07220 [Rhodomicrobium sp. Az07]|uniref:hypothetical protein n=1 Tax=Rhodomicrobium sp. Az07 TaxID=2839034 RepID=UPI001BED1CBC|nr:hypothetical protein [Rhodomicrobium sp. Az07]MBT3070654.1 hypothetical protein [Rhodomicrobium sp. Az07]